MSEHNYILTVIVADISPLEHANLPPSMRVVQIHLTDDQKRRIGLGRGESISQVILERHDIATHWSGK